MQNSIAPNFKVKSSSTPLFGKIGTFFLVLLVLCVFVLTQLVTLVAAAFLVIPEQMATDMSMAMMAAINHGTILTVSLFFTFVLIYAAIVAVIKVRKKPIGNYLPMIGVPKAVALKVFALWLLFVVGSEAILQLLDRDPLVFMDDIYQSAGSVFWLGFAIVVVVPIYEEMIFRGILWQATAEQFVNKRTGAIFASIIIGLLFTVVHIQYDMIEMLMIFVLALILGYARYRSGSLLLPIAMHMLKNGLVFTQYALT